MKTLTDNERQIADVAMRRWSFVVEAYDLKGVKLTLQFKKDLKVYRNGIKKHGMRAPACSYYHAGHAIIALDRDAVEQQLTRTLEETLPHHFAHIVCMHWPNLGEGHDIGWQRVCKALGGTGFHNYGYNDHNNRPIKRKATA